jgi:CBS-domain-containing membrane protein
MFSIYGESGRVFKGAMDELRRVQTVKAVQAIKGAEFAELLRNDMALHKPAEPPVVHLSQAPAGREAVTAYAQAGAAHMPRHALSRVDDIMSRSVVTVPLTMRVLEAWQMLTHRDLGQAPVVDKNGFLVGLLTRAELVQPERLPLPGTKPLVWQALLAQPVSSIMRTPVAAVHSDADIRQVAQILIDNRLPGLPVVLEDGAVVGFVSRTDILRAVVHDPPLDLWS